MPLRLFVSRSAGSSHTSEVSCNACLIVQQIHNEDNLMTTHLVIMSVIRQLQSSTPYGAMPCVVQEQVLQSIDVSEVEYR